MDEARSREPRKGKDEPGMSQLLDPVAWERRVREARARRAEALAQRGQRRGQGLTDVQHRLRPTPPRPNGAPSRDGDTGQAALSLRPFGSADGLGQRRPSTPEAGGAGAVAPARTEAAPVGPAAEPAVGGRHERAAETVREAAIKAAGGRAAPAAHRDVSATAMPEGPAEASTVPAPAKDQPGLPQALPHVSAAYQRRAPAPAPAPAAAAPHARADSLQTPPRARPRDAALRATRDEATEQPQAAATAAGWTRSRIAAVFAAGIVIGLAGAFAIREPVLDRVAGGAFDATAPVAGSSPVVGAEPAAAANPSLTETTGAAATETPPPAATDVADGGWEPAALSGARPQPPPAPAWPQEAGESLSAAALPEPAPEAVPSPPAPVVALTTPEAEAPSLAASPDPTERPTAPAAAEGVVVPDVPEFLRPPHADERPIARPAPPRIATAAETTEAAGADAAATGVDAPEPEGEPAGVPPARVLVHVPSGLASSEADRAVAALGAAGYTPASRLPAQFTIGSTNIRYYHPEDAAAARIMAAAISAETGSTAVARDFTDFRPQPLAGTIEVWLAGEAPSAPAAQASSQPAPPPAVQRRAPPQAAAPPPQQPQQQRRGSSNPQEAAMRELEKLADDIARAISRSLGN